MGANRENTYWGLNLDDDFADEAKALLGKDEILDRGATKGNETEARELAILILDDPTKEHLGARRILLRQKEAFGTGIDPQLP